MGRISSLERAKENIIEFFNDRNQATYSSKEIAYILDTMRYEWELAVRIQESQFLEFLLRETHLEGINLRFPSMTYNVFVWKNFNLLSVVQKINQSGYFSHYTAASLHELTEQMPKNYYFKLESQVAKKGELQQNRIDSTFRRPPRVSNRYAIVKDYKIFWLSGAITDNLGIVSHILNTGESIRVTNIERTLIDIAIRPMYAGGVGEVLKVYRAAKGKFSVNKLRVILKSMRLTYPYHQAIGFYLERSQVYSEGQIAVFDSIPKEFNFYLTYQMSNPEYSERWKLFYPRGF